MPQCGSTDLKTIDETKEVKVPFAKSVKYVIKCRHCNQCGANYRLGDDDSNTQAKLNMQFLSLELIPFQEC